MNSRTLYAALAIVGTVVPYAAFLPWLLDNGIAPGLFLSAMFATDISAFFSLDVIVSAVVVSLTAVFSTELSGGKKAGVIAVTCLIGVSAGLPLLLFLKSNKAA